MREIFNDHRRNYRSIHFVLARRDSDQRRRDSDRAILTSGFKF